MLFVTLMLSVSSTVFAENVILDRGDFDASYMPAKTVPNIQKAANDLCQDSISDIKSILEESVRINELWVVRDLQKRIGNRPRPMVNPTNIQDIKEECSKVTISISGKPYFEKRSNQYGVGFKTTMVCTKRKANSNANDIVVEYSVKDKNICLPALSL